MDSGHLVKPGSPAIREVVPGAQFEFNPPTAHIQTWLAPQESALREYLRVLIKRKWTVIGCLLDHFHHRHYRDVENDSDLPRIRQHRYQQARLQPREFQGFGQHGRRVLRPHRFGYGGQHSTE